MISLTDTVAVPLTVVPVAVARTVIFVFTATLEVTVNNPEEFIETPATVGLIVHVTACDAPSGVTSALNCNVEPRVTVVAFPSAVTFTPDGIITPDSTVIVAVSEIVVPVAVAVMIAVPALTGVTTPVAETVATAVLLEDHVTA